MGEDDKGRKSRKQNSLVMPLVRERGAREMLVRIGEARLGHIGDWGKGCEDEEREEDGKT